MTLEKKDGIKIKADRIFKLVNPTVILGFLTIVTLIIVALFIIGSHDFTLNETEPDAEEYTPETTEPVSELSNFTQTEIERIEKWVPTSEADYSEMFEVLDEFNLEKSIELCDKELFTGAVTCYRILAIKKPEHKEEVCANIKEELCSRPSSNSNCLEQIEFHREECLGLLPFLR
ncbi:MAG: hypothetical protein KJ858_01645 [Nanoarchaeota archaeon]|nr:hypothetical protein [Nanoarchaeota archaeon]